jgi:adenylylsulfate kinase-like enzyme
VPEKPDLRLDTSGHTREQSVAAVLDLLAEHGLA